MKILVTGGAGFIGSHVADAYLAAGHDVIIVDNFTNGRRANVPAGARVYHVDLRDPALFEVFERERPEVVNHHAAQASVNVSVQNPSTDADINIRGSLNLIACATTFSVKKFIYISTGGAMFGEPRYLPVDEDHPVLPLAPYGISKSVISHYLRVFEAVRGLNYTTLAYPNIYGPRQDPLGEAGVIAIFARQMLNGAPVTINGTGEQERDFLYVGDIARANVLALEAAPGTTYLTGSGGSASVNRVFEELARITGYPLEPRRGPALPGEVFKISVSGEKIARELGWQPEIDLAEGLTRTVDYFRQHS